MFNWFKRKEVSLRDYLNQTKKIYINGVIFRIKKINIEDHLSGLNVILKARALYEKEKVTPEMAVDQTTKIKKVLRDVIFAGVVKPELTMKKEETSKIHIDEIINDLDLANKLGMAIFEYTYGKKKSKSKK